jgi:hypothetical protein
MKVITRTCSITRSRLKAACACADGNNLRRRRKIAKAKAHFDPFANGHIRTNSFMLAQDLMLQPDFAGERTKFNSLVFEADKNSLTKQILQMNLKAVVVGRHGLGYEKGRWFESHTSHIGDNAT